MITSLKDRLWPTFEAIEEAQSSESAMMGLQTGFVDLDEKTAGWQPGDLIIVSGVTGMGKSALAYHFATATAVPDRPAPTLPPEQGRASRNAEVGQNTLLVTLECSEAKCTSRLICSLAKVNTNRLFTGRLTDADYARLAIAAGWMNNAPLHLLHSPRLTVEELCGRAREWSASCEGKLIVIDSLNLLRVQHPVAASNREQEIGMIVRELKSLALELNIPIIAVASTSRSVDQRFEKRPSLQDLRDSGDVENVADVVVFVFRHSYYTGPVDKDGNDVEFLAELSVEKNRSGPLGLFVVGFSQESGSYFELPASAK